MKLYSVQYLRGLAALIVVVAHAFEYPLVKPSAVLVRLSGIGVTLFFVISGFIMVLISGHGRFDRLTFYRRRIERVVPLYWVATLVLAVVAAIAPNLLKNTRFDVQELVLSLLFIPHYRGNGELVPVLKLGWTLNLEMFFYLCFGMLAPLAARTRVLLMTVLLLGLAIVGAIVDFRNALLHAYTTIHFVSFAIGMWMGLALLDRRPRWPTSAAALVAGSGLGLLALSLVVVPSAILPQPLFIAMAAGSALLLAAGISFEGKLGHFRLPTLLGDASYSLYLAHMYVVVLVSVVARRAFPQLGWTGTALAGIVGGIAGGLVMHVVLEKPLLRIVTRRRASVQRSDRLRDGDPPALMGDDASEGRVA